MTKQSLRFYPESIKPFALEPKKDRFAITKIDNNVGEGLRCLGEFFPGQIVFAFTGYLISEITQFTLQVRPGVHLHDPFVMGKVLHSCDPNTDCDMERQIFVARKKINFGDMITMDYDQTEEVLYKPFYCSCKADNCRGFIQGNAFYQSQGMLANFSPQRK